MRSYADQLFYQQEHLLGRAEQIPLTEFLYWATKASRFIDLHTFNKVSKLDEIPLEIRHAACSLAEIYYKNEQSKDPNNISSESTGSHSVSYVNQTVKLEDFHNELITQIKTDLGDTGLLFGGVR